MAERPSLQFYPKDWRNNANLRRCGWGARGAWIEVIGLMHDADEYGVLRWTLKEIAQSVGAPLALLQELASKSVMKGCDKGFCEPLVFAPRHARQSLPTVTLIEMQEGPIWYSSRMVRDDYVRAHAGASTRFGSTKPSTTPPNGTTPRHSPSQRDGDRQGEPPSQRRGDGSSSSSAVKSTCENHRVSDPRARAPSSTGPHTDQAAQAIGIARPLPNDWQPSDEDRAWLRSGRPDLNEAAVKAETEQFRLWVAERSTMSANWSATWRRFLSKTKARDGHSNGGKREWWEDSVAVGSREWWEARCKTAQEHYGGEWPTRWGLLESCPADLRLKYGLRKAA